jgi:hypothetical protein
MVAPNREWGNENLGDAKKIARADATLPGRRHRSLCVPPLAEAFSSRFHAPRFISSSDDASLLPVVPRRTGTIIEAPFARGTVGTRRRRFAELRLSGLWDEPRSGAPRENGAYERLPSSSGPFPTDSEIAADAAAMAQSVRAFRSKSLRFRHSSHLSTWKHSAGTCIAGDRAGDRWRYARSNGRPAVWP